MKKLLELPQFIRATCKFLKTCAGITTNQRGQQNYNSLFLTIWIALLGFPIVTILLGPIVAKVWIPFCFGVLAISNIDIAIKGENNRCV